MAKWNKPTHPQRGKRAVITLTVEIETSKSDSPAEIAHALIGTAVKELTTLHEVTNRVMAVKVDGKSIYAETKIGNLRINS